MKTRSGDSSSFPRSALSITNISPRRVDPGFEPERLAQNSPGQRPGQAASRALPRAGLFQPFGLICDRQRGAWQRGARAAFTLLELLVVVAILAILAGGLVVSYSGLDEQAGHGVDASNTASVDRAVRTFATLQGAHPDMLDSLLVSGSPAALLNRLHEEARAHFVFDALSAPEVAALNSLGVFSVFDVDGGSGYDNSSTGPVYPEILIAPNNIFHLPAANGFGVQRVLSSSAGSAAFLNPSDAALRTKLRLSNDRVVVFGLSKNSTMGDQSLRGSLSSMPFGRVGRGQYGRFFLLFKVSGGTTSTPYFVGALDPHGHTVDDAYDEYQKGSR